MSGVPAHPTASTLDPSRLAGGDGYAAPPTSSTPLAGIRGQQVGPASSRGGRIPSPVVAQGRRSRVARFGGASNARGDKRTQAGGDRRGRTAPGRPRFRARRYIPWPPPPVKVPPPPASRALHIGSTTHPRPPLRPAHHIAGVTGWVSNPLPAFRCPFSSILVHSRSSIGPVFGALWATIQATPHPRRPLDPPRYPRCTPFAADVVESGIEGRLCRAKAPLRCTTVHNHDHHRRPRASAVPLPTGERSWPLRPGFSLHHRDRDP